MSLLDDVKLLKGITDELQDNLLALIIDESEERVLGYINAGRTEKLEVIPGELNYIIRDVAIKRFNRLNSEGATKDSEEGRSFEWQSSYLDEYATVLDRYKDPAVAPDQTRRGSVRFY